MFFFTLSYPTEEYWEPFRTCFEIHDSFDAELHEQYGGSLCMDNDFSAITVPAECGRPLATLTTENHKGDARVRGQQVLYCIPAE